jgi:type IV secretion system protein VirB10
MRDDAQAFAGAANDPRTTMTADDLHGAARWDGPRVARAGRGGDMLGLAAAAVGALAVGAFTLVSLSQGRTEAAPLAQESASSAAAADTESVAPSAAAPVTTPASATPSATRPASPPVAEDPNQSRANPMIVDNSAPEPAAAKASGPAAASAAAGRANLTADEQFAVRVGGEDRVARAQRLSNPSTTIVQGALIPAVLETALNSDLPGYARAIVSRDVRGFDGARVLIPRGSRLVGEYKSGLQTGQTRVQVVWTRLVRPDGVSIDLGSPGGDELGQSGLAGGVQRHYGRRYGPASVLSLLSGLASGLGGGSSSTVVVGSTASSAAGQALQTDGQIPPTIRLPQGAPIQVFTARDLDFSDL